MPIQMHSNERLRLAIAIPENRRALWVAMLAQCRDIELITALIPESRFARDWKKALNCSGATSNLDEILSSPDIDAIVLTAGSRANERSADEAVSAGKHVLSDFQFFGDLESFDLRAETAVTNGAALFTWMPWRVDDAFKLSRVMLEDGLFGPHPHATFWTSAIVKVGANPQSTFTRHMGPALEIANWLFGPAKAVSADLDLSGGRKSAIICSHPQATVVHHFSSGSERASLRIDDAGSECKIEMPASGWDSLDSSATLEAKRNGKPLISFTSASKQEKLASLASQLGEFARQSLNCSSDCANQSASRLALEVASAAMIASRDNINVALPLSPAPAADRDSSSKTRGLLPATISH